jgi:hypothetical protein
MALCWRDKADSTMKMFMVASMDDPFINTSNSLRGDSSIVTEGRKALTRFYGSIAYSSVLFGIAKHELNLKSCLVIAQDVQRRTVSVSANASKLRHN